MGQAFAQFFDGVKNGAYGFADMITYIVNFAKELWNAEHVVPMRDAIWGFVSSYSAYLPFILFAVSIIVALAGKRMYGVLRFLAFFAVGFALGAYLLSPLVMKVIPQIPVWVTALVTGIVAAVLSKLLYILAIIAATGYCTYMVCYTGTLVPALTRFTAGRMVTSVVVCVIAVVIVLVLLKYIEMAGTAALGGYGAAIIIKRWYDYTALSMFEGRTWLPILIVAGVIALIGFIVQFRTRRRF